MNLIEIPKTAETWLNLAPINQINEFKVANWDRWRILRAGPKIRVWTCSKDKVYKPPRGRSQPIFSTFCAEIFVSRSLDEIIDSRMPRLTRGEDPAQPNGAVVDINHKFKTTVECKVLS